MSDFVFYLLMRTDLPSMSVGRAAAQASHATNFFMKEYGTRKDVTEWTKETEQGFGTAIVLSTNLTDLKKLTGTAQAQPNKKFPNGLVIDPDYRFSATAEIIPHLDQSTINKWDRNTPEDTTISISKKEVTCGFIFGSKAELEPFLKDIPLYPN